MKRSGKFWRKNERDVMELLGLEPTPNSGSGWLVKEDGQNDEVICQLKSTDAQSISFKLEDFNTLEYNSSVVHKVPLFVLQFCKDGELFLVCKPGDLVALANYIDGDVVSVKEQKQLQTFIKQNRSDENETRVKKSIKSGSKERQKFHQQRTSKLDKTKYIK